MTPPDIFIKHPKPDESQQPVSASNGSSEFWGIHLILIVSNKWKVITEGIFLLSFSLFFFLGSFHHHLPWFFILCFTYECLYFSLEALCISYILLSVSWYFLILEADFWSWQRYQLYWAISYLVVSTSMWYKIYVSVLADI